MNTLNITEVSTQQDVQFFESKTLKHALCFEMELCTPLHIWVSGTFKRRLNWRNCGTFPSKILYCWEPYLIRCPSQRWSQFTCSSCMLPSLLFVPCAKDQGKAAYVVLSELVSGA